MKCNNCGFENKDKAKFCTKCGQPLNQPADPMKSDNSKFVIIALVAIIVILAGTIGYFALNNSGGVQSDDAAVANDTQDGDSVDSDDDGSDNGASESSSKSKSKTTSVASESKSWVSIGKYSGSGSGSQTIDVPSGKIKVVLSAYPIKNYATNHLYVSGSNGKSGGVDWGSQSAVETRSDSFTYSSSTSETFTIDYYETVSWEVEFFAYE